LTNLNSNSEIGFGKRLRKDSLRVAKVQGVQRIIYLGGLGDPAAKLSAHLRSRQETGNALREAGVPVSGLVGRPFAHHERFMRPVTNIDGVLRPTSLLRRRNAPSWIFFLEPLRSHSSLP